MPAGRRRARWHGGCRHPAPLRGERAPPAQAVVDQVADCRAVTRAGKPVALPPVGERGRNRAVLLEDLLEHLDGGLDVGTRPHAASGQPGRRDLQRKLDPHDGEDQEP